MKGSLGRSLTPKESFFKDMILLVLLLPVFFASWFRKPRPGETSGEGTPGIEFNDRSADILILPAALVVTGLWSWVFGWSFYLWFVVVGLIGYFLIKAVLKRTVRAEWATALWVAVISFAFMYYCWQHLPLKDYRAYAVGKSITEQKAVALADPPKYDNYLIYRDKQTGKEEEFLGTNYPWNDSVWMANHEFVKNRAELVHAGTPSLVDDFAFTDKDGNDITEDLLNETQPILLIVVRNVKEAPTDCLPAINALVDAAYKAGWYPYGASNSSYEEIETFRHDNQCAFDFLRGDDIVLKTMIRSNPGVMLLQQGMIRGQWHCNDVPSFEEAKAMLK